MATGAMFLVIKLRMRNNIHWEILYLEGLKQQTVFRLLVSRGRSSYCWLYEPAHAHRDFLDAFSMRVSQLHKLWYYVSLEYSRVYYYSILFQIIAKFILIYSGKSIYSGARNITIYEIPHLLAIPACSSLLYRQ